MRTLKTLTREKTKTTYGVRGFRQFARDVDGEWSRRFPHDEGVVDADEHSIKIVTIHSSKGLEWPVVIPINTASGARPPEQFVHRRSDDTLHWMLGGDLLNFPPNAGNAAPEAVPLPRPRRTLMTWWNLRPAAYVAPVRQGADGHPQPGNLREPFGALGQAQRAGMSAILTYPEFTPRRPTAWLGISDSNFDVKSENSSL